MGAGHSGGAPRCSPGVRALARRHSRWLGLLPVVLFGVSGCGNSGMDDLLAYAEQVKARPPGPLEPLPEIQQVDTFVYEPGNRRDPFVMDDRSALAAAPRPTGGPVPDPLRRKEELEQFSLDTLRMVGTLEQDDTLWGLVTTPDGVLHRVRVGNYLGRNNGQIVRILENEIQVMEIVGEGPGDWREQAAAIALK